MRAGAVAQRSDLLQIGDLITAVNGIKTTKLKHEDVINLLKNAGERVSLEIEYEIPPAGLFENHQINYSKISLNKIMIMGSFMFVTQFFKSQDLSCLQPSLCGTVCQMRQ